MPRSREIPPQAVQAQEAFANALSNLLAPFGFQSNEIADLRTPTAAVVFEGGEQVKNRLELQLRHKLGLTKIGARAGAHWPPVTDLAKSAGLAPPDADFWLFCAEDPAASGIPSHRAGDGPGHFVFNTRDDAPERAASAYFERQLFRYLSDDLPRVSTPENALETLCGPLFRREAPFTAPELDYEPALLRNLQAALLLAKALKAERLSVIKARVLALSASLPEETRAILENAARAV